MDLVPGIRLALRHLYAEPETVLPYYLAGAGVPLVGQSVLLVGVVVAYAVLAVQGRIAGFVAAISALDLGRLDPVDPDPAAVERLADALALLVTPETIAVAAVTLLGVVVAALVAGAVVAAAQLHAVRAALDRERPLGTDRPRDDADPTMGADHPLAVGVTGATRDGWRFVRLALLRWLLYAVPIGLAFALVALVGAISPVLAALAAFASFLVLAPVLLAVTVALLFVPQAIVVDDVGVLAGLRHNWEFVRANPWTATGYLVVQLGLAIAVGTVAGTMAVLSMPLVVPLLTLAVTTPFLGLLGTAVYLDPEPRQVADGLPRARVRVRAAVDRSLGAVGAFVRARAGLVLAAIALFAVGVAAGWEAIGAFALPPRSPPAPGEVFGLVPVDDFANIAANNWRVALGQAAAGAALGVPPVVGLLFNGFVVGGVAGAGFEPVAFLALVAPHGVIEIPALAVAGALGISLGWDVWRYLRGRADAVDLAVSVRRAFAVVVGLLPVFVVAAFVEAFVTPWVGALIAGL